MASYPDGTVFESAQTFPRNTTFGAGCVFPDGCTFNNRCVFGDACVFGKGCQLLWTSRRQPPHETGTACVFADGCTIMYTRIGEANLISNPSQYSPVSQGADTLVGNKNSSSWPPKEVTAEGCDRCGQILSGEKVSEDWCEASKLSGIDGDMATVKRCGKEV